MCKQPYEDWQKAKTLAFDAWREYHKHKDPPHRMLPTYYFWEKEEKRLLELKRKTEAISFEKYRILKSKCKEADTFILASKRNVDPNSYVEFNDYVQSLYKTRNP
jgi:hypothetical protein